MEALPTTPERECRDLYWLESRVDIDEIVDAATECIAPIAQRVGVTLTTHVEPGLPSIWADHDRLVHVVSTLLDNAVLFSTARGVVSIDACSSGPEVLITIMQKSGSTRPFDSELLGERREAATNGSRGAADAGSGIHGKNLGLRMCREIVEDRRGRIWCEPHDTGGTTFKVAFPATCYEGRDAGYAQA
jgi:signal transduction histidine kinase